MLMLALIISSICITNVKAEDEEGEEFEEGEGCVSGLANIILYLTIAAVVGTIGYIAWKVVSIKKSKAIR